MFPQLREMPFVRLLAPVVAGVMLVETPHGGSLYKPMMALVCVGILLFLSTLFYRMPFKWRMLPGFALTIGILGLAFIHTYHFPDFRQTSHFSHVKHPKYVVAELVENPDQGNRVGALAKAIYAVDSFGVKHEVTGNLSLSFFADSNAMRLKCRDIVALQPPCKPFSKPLNPHGFDYGANMHLKNVHYQCFANAGKWKHLGKGDGNPLQNTLSILSRPLLEIFQRRLGNGDVGAVAAALVLGFRTDISEEVMKDYAATGAMHVLSVSGLHVGLLAGMLMYLLSLVKSKNDKWQWTKVGLALAFIWLFALISGGSASVMRSALMFTMVTMASAMARNSNIYNTMASSACILLAFNPLWLYNIGFQLSYLALLGIVMFYPPIYKRWFFNNWLLDKAWSLMAVSLAAQIGTLPISLYYFHQFPTYFWLSGYWVIPLSTLALPAGIGMLVFDKVPFLGDMFANILYYSVAWMNAGLAFLSKLPFSTISDVWLGGWEATFWYMALGFGVYGWIKRRKMVFWTALAIPIFLLSVRTVMVWQSQNQEKLVVYHSNKGTAIDFMRGGEVFAWQDSTALKTQWKFMANRQANRAELRAKPIIGKDTVDVPGLKINASSANFEGFRLGVVKGRPTTSSLTSYDALVISGNPKIDISELMGLSPKLLIIDATNSHFNQRRWIEEAVEVGMPIWNVSTQGAWEMVF